MAGAIKNPPVTAGDIRDTGSIPGGQHGNPLPYSCLENPMERGAWRAIVWSIGLQSVGHNRSNLAHMQIANSGFTESYGKCVLNFERKCQTAFQLDYTIFAYSLAIYVSSNYSRFLPAPRLISLLHSINLMDV